MSGSPTDLDVALSAAEAGAATVRAAYRGELTRHVKDGRDFATDADLNAERALLEVIRAARPNDGTTGEESGATEGSGSRRWLIDPLCGTLNFAAQTSLVAVNVALVDDGHVLALSPRIPSDATTLAVAWVAAGRRAAYVSDGRFVDNVHFAAGIGLCRRAGCVVTDLAGDPLDT